MLKIRLRRYGHLFESRENHKEHKDFFAGESMSEQEWLAMRGFVDIVLGAVLVGRLLWHSTQLPSLSARLALFTVVTLFLALLELLGVWSFREVAAAARMLPIVWPIIAITIYLTVKSIKMW